MHEEEIIRNLPKALVSWYDFKPGEEALFVSGGDEACEVLFEALEEKGIKTVKVEADSLSKPETHIYDRSKFDYVVAAGILERSKRPAEILSELKGFLKPSGRLFVGAENRFALRYFCGDKDRFSGHVLDSIDGYNKVIGKGRENLKGRAYTKAELAGMFDEAGFAGYKFYSILPCLTQPQIIVSEGYRPNESIDVRVFPQYNSPETIFFGGRETVCRPYRESYVSPNGRCFPDRMSCGRE